MDRRQFLAAGAAAALLRPAFGSAAAPLDLGALAASRGIQFGSAFDREIFDDAAYAAFLPTQCRLGAVSNSVKFDWLRNQSWEPDYTAADRLVDYATSKGLAVHGAALIWNDWPTEWIKRASNAERRYWFDRHITETVGRYAGRVHSWDAVNEPFWPLDGGGDGGLRVGPWLEAFGRDYIARAFERAAAADPNAVLVLNEAFCEQNDDLGNGVRPRLLELANELKQKGAKLDAVGFQAHLMPHLPYDDAAFAAYVAEMAALGVAIHLTEFDVNDSSFPDDIAERDAAVAARVRDFLGAVLQVRQVDTLICWHLSDRHSWYDEVDWYRTQVSDGGGNPARGARSHFFDRDLKIKPAALAMAEAIAASAPR